MTIGKRRATRALIGALLLVGCGAEAPGDEHSGGAQTEGWQFVDRSYPFIGDHGENVCAEWRAISREDGAGQREREWYWFDKMNEMLAGRLVFDDPDSVAAARSVLSQVVTCEDARLFTRLRNEHSRSQPVAQAPSVPADIIDNEEFVDDVPSERIDKVADGHVFASPVTVRLTVTGGSGGPCSGVLIGAKAMLTAAHCVPYAVPQSAHIRVDYGIGTSCINVRCDDPSNANAFVWAISGYSGTEDAPHDMAIVIADLPWFAPANTNASWARILNRQIQVGDQFFVEGYGVTASTPLNVGLGTERRGNLFETVGAIGPSDWFMNVTSGRGRPCVGDSGGPANNDFNMLGKANPGFVPGVFGVSSWGQGLCGSPGDREYYSQLFDKVSFIESFFVGGCYNGSSNGNAYIRCW